MAIFSQYSEDYFRKDNLLCLQYQNVTLLELQIVFIQLRVQSGEKIMHVFGMIISD